MAVQADVEEVGFVVPVGNAGERPDLGVAELALGQRLRQQRQPGQRASDADFLPRGMGIDAARPGEPVGAGQRPLRGLDLAAVELGDEDEQPVRGGVDMGGEGGNGAGESVVVHLSRQAGLSERRIRTKCEIRGGSGDSVRERIDPLHFEIYCHHVIISWATVPMVSYSTMLHSIELHAERVMYQVRPIAAACGRCLRNSSGRGSRFPMAAPRSPSALVLLLASSITLTDTCWRAASAMCCPMIGCAITH